MVAAAYSYPSAEHPRKAKFCVILRVKFWKVTRKYTAAVAKKLNGTYTLVNEKNHMHGQDRAIKILCRNDTLYGCVTAVQGVKVG